MYLCIVYVQLTIICQYILYVSGVALPVAYVFRTDVPQQIKSCAKTATDTALRGPATICTESAPPVSLAKCASRNVNSM